MMSALRHMNGRRTVSDGRKLQLSRAGRTRTLRREIRSVEKAETLLRRDPTIAHRAPLCGKCHLTAKRVNIGRRAHVSLRRPSRKVAPWDRNEISAPLSRSSIKIRQDLSAGS
jgi:hypothetical protein